MRGGRVGVSLRLGAGVVCWGRGACFRRVWCVSAGRRASWWCRGSGAGCGRRLRVCVFPLRAPPRCCCCGRGRVRLRWCGPGLRGAGVFVSVVGGLCCRVRWSCGARRRRWGFRVVFWCGLRVRGGRLLCVPFRCSSVVGLAGSSGPAGAFSLRWVGFASGVSFLGLPFLGSVVGLAGVSSLLGSGGAFFSWLPGVSLVGGGSGAGARLPRSLASGGGGPRVSGLGGGRAVSGVLWR